MLDNAKIHHGSDAMPVVKSLLDVKGVRLLYLPAYSPELNPCDLVFGHVKQRMTTSRGIDPMCIEALRWFAEVSPALMNSFYRHCIMGPIDNE